MGGRALLGQRKREPKGVYLSACNVADETNRRRERNGKKVVGKSEKKMGPTFWNMARGIGATRCIRLHRYTRFTLSPSSSLRNGKFFGCDTQDPF